ncbi:P-loop containing nucleoside triphosphate hydrolase protein [Russula aff. rugulosa BPL654]|nr:P-loop containing nucleoside triphosphate hydrolase protein [Russula aff. rugulosa BPL654]
MSRKRRAVPTTGDSDLDVGASLPLASSTSDEESSDSGLSPWILRSLMLQGFRTPTPIQRLSIPVLLSNPPRDLVGMARTGSGKSLAFLIPLHAGDKVGDQSESRNRSQGQGLRWGLVVGGESMEEQFEMISGNPDVIIATPGRLLHLAVEMNLDLRSVQYVVFDEADRLFEMGFETALTEIIHRLPPSRQTLLFSATLPNRLQDPKLVRLDAESKISADLRMAFFSVKQDEKDACLLVLLRDIIRVPIGVNASQDRERGGEPKSKRVNQDQFAAPHQTLVFAATKHHVEYLTTLLTAAGYAVSHIYGSLDHSARFQQMDQFRCGRTNVLVVTDVAARGIDIPVLANVVNYDFPQGARVFVHRVGRTARAGRSGWAWSFVSQTELPYLVELQLFLGRPLTCDASDDSEAPYTENLVIGAFMREVLDDEVAYIRALGTENHALSTLRSVMRKGQGLYERSRGRASPAGYTRAKEMSREPARWGLVAAGASAGIHPVLRLKGHAVGKNTVVEDERRRALLAAVDSFRPIETALEIGSRGKNGNADLMKERRKALTKAMVRREIIQIPDGSLTEVEMADDSDINAVFGAVPPKPSKGIYHDSEFYIPYSQAGSNTEKGYSLRDGETFAEQARHSTFDLAGDEGVVAQRRAQSKLFVRGDGTGSDNVKMVRAESGVKLPASYRSGRFDEWRAKARVSLPRVGEAVPDRRPPDRKRFKHTSTTAAKPLDKLTSSYERKARVQKKVEAVSAVSAEEPVSRGRHITGRRYGGKSLGQVRGEIKSAEQIRKARKIVEKRKAKNSRPSRKKGKR